MKTFFLKFALFFFKTYLNTTIHTHEFLDALVCLDWNGNAFRRRPQ